LYTLIHPLATKSFLVDGNAKSLTTAVTLRLYQSHIESIGMLTELLGAGHPCRTSTDNEDTFLDWRWHGEIVVVGAGVPGTSMLASDSL
jgi:hypothetical protein